MKQLPWAGGNLPAAGGGQEERWPAGGRATHLGIAARAEGLLFLHGLESNPGSSLQTEEEAGLP